MSRDGVHPVFTGSKLCIYEFYNQLFVVSGDSVDFGIIIGGDSEEEQVAGR